jgi:hypothetical protein
MAIVQNPLIGKASGKAGNIIFQFQYGKNTIRAKPIYITPNPSLAREFVKKRMAKANGLLKNNSSIIVSYAPKALTECPTSSFFLSQITKNFRQTTLDEPFELINEDIFNRGTTFFAHNGINNCTYDFNYLRLELQLTGGELYRLTDDNMFNYIIFNDRLNLTYRGNDATFNSNSQEIEIHIENAKKEELRYILLTIVNCHNSYGELPSDFFMPLCKEDMNLFYLFKKIKDI